MTKPAFTANPSDVKMGAAIVVYDGNVLGYTLNDSVSLNLTHSKTPVEVDQQALPIAEYVTGMEGTVDVELGKCDMDTLKLLPGGDATGLKDPSGINLMTEGKELVLYPLDDNDTRVFRFPKAYPVMNGAMQFSKNTPQVIPMQFGVYIESAGGYIMKFA